MMPVRMSEVPSWDRTTNESQVSAGTLPSRATRWKQPWLWPSRSPFPFSRWVPLPYSALGSEKCPGSKFLKRARTVSSRLSGTIRPLPGRRISTCGVLPGISP
jgi:hypothetical protein